MRFEKLSNRFFGAELCDGEITLNKGHSCSFFYIVEMPVSEEVLERETIEILSLVMSHFATFKFYGKYALQWKNIFDMLYRRILPEKFKEFENITKICTDPDEFIGALQTELLTRTFVPCDIYLIYDDEILYKTIMEKLKCNCWSDKYI